MFARMAASLPNLSWQSRGNRVCWPCSSASGMQCRRGLLRRFKAAEPVQLLYRLIIPCAVSGNLT